MTHTARSGVAVAVFAYACIVLMRPLHQLLQFDPATVNPPGAVGDFIAVVRFIYQWLVPALYGVSACLVFLGSRVSRLLFPLALCMELAVGLAYVYIGSEIDMLGTGQGLRLTVVGAWFLVPAALLLAVRMVTRGDADETGA